jgi:hypothetical protein
MVWSHFIRANVYYSPRPHRRKKLKGLRYRFLYKVGGGMNTSTSPFLNRNTATMMSRKNCTGFLPSCRGQNKFSAGYTNAVLYVKSDFLIIVLYLRSVGCKKLHLQCAACVLQHLVFYSLTHLILVVETSTWWHSISLEIWHIIVFPFIIFCPSIIL